MSTQSLISQETPESFIPPDATAYGMFINFIHFGVVSPLLSYIAVQKNESNPLVYPTLWVLVATIVPYHGVRFVKKANVLIKQRRENTISVNV